MPRSGPSRPRRRCSRLRYPYRLRAYVVRLVREHPFALADDPQPVDARRFLPRHGARLAFDLLAHRAADLAGKSVPPTPSGSGSIASGHWSSRSGRSRTGSPTWRWTGAI